tara:strand:- start:4354 stop:5085 length:732 start_codon:yes stop_codon:yes gene_type:complete
MSSELKVTNIKHSSSGSNNLVLASDGTTTVNGALTASGGIANAGTISAGTLSSSVSVPASIGSSMVLIKTITTSNGDTEILFQNNYNGVVFDSTYRIYVLHFSGVIPTTNSKNVYIQVGSSGGYDTGCRGGYHNWYDDGSTNSGASANLSRSYFWDSAPGPLRNVKANGGLTGTFIFYNPADANYCTNAYFHTTFYSSNGYFYGMTGSTTTVNNYVVDRLKFTTESDSFQSGAKISFYGIKDA